MPVPHDPSTPPPPAPPLASPWRWLLLALACASLAAGVVGVFVPGLPTTPFLLLAAWAAARSSPRLHRWLLRHRLFGQLIADWQAGGRVRRRAKWNATVAMTACGLLLFWVGSRWWLAALACACMAAVLCWLWRRPEPPAA